MGKTKVSKKEAWKKLSRKINAKYIEGSLFKGSRVEYKYNNWKIYLDTYTVSTGQTTITYTRMRAPFISTNDFYFKVHRKGIFSKFGKKLEMQDIIIGDDYFDENYIVKGNDEILIKKILLSNEIRGLLYVQPKLILEVKDNEGKFGPKFKDNESELSFMVTGVIKDIDVLKNLFELFSKLLDEFEANDITINKTPKVKLYKRSKTSKP